MSPNELRVLLLIVGVFILLGIYYFGRPNNEKKSDPRDRSADRLEPWIYDGDESPAQVESVDGEDRPMAAVDSESISAPEAEPEVEMDPEPIAGERPNSEFDLIVTLFMVAREGGTIAGPDLMVAAEKAGLVFGDKCIYHRLIDGKPDEGPVFSMANLNEPGSFQLSAMDRLSTPGVCFFMTLPGPMSALDSLDTLMPAAERMAELLDAQLLDEERNALGRQRILSLRDEMRQYDRKQKQENVSIDF